MIESMPQNRLVLARLFHLLSASMGEDTLSSGQGGGGGGGEQTAQDWATESLNKARGNK